MTPDHCVSYIGCRKRIGQEGVTVLHPLTRAAKLKLKGQPSVKLQPDLTLSRHFLAQLPHCERGPCRLLLLQIRGRPSAQTLSLNK
eukprot:scaffold277106_cov17-Tisochrysis_lutea.AAC.1